MQLLCFKHLSDLFEKIESKGKRNNLKYKPSFKMKQNENKSRKQWK